MGEQASLYVLPGAKMLGLTLFEARDGGEMLVARMNHREIYKTILKPKFQTVEIPLLSCPKGCTVQLTLGTGWRTKHGRNVTVRLVAAWVSDDKPDTKSTQKSASNRGAIRTESRIPFADRSSSDREKLIVSSVLRKLVYPR